MLLTYLLTYYPIKNVHVIPIYRMNHISKFWFIPFSSFALLCSNILHPHISKNPHSLVSSHILKFHLNFFSSAQTFCVFVFDLLQILFFVWCSFCSHHERNDPLEKKKRQQATNPYVTCIYISSSSFFFLF